MAKTSKPKGPPKISFVLEQSQHEDLKLYAASQPGALSPGPYMREKALEEANKGKQLRARLASKTR